MKWFLLALGLGALTLAVYLGRRAWNVPEADLVQRLQAIGWPVKRSERV